MRRVYLDYNATTPLSPEVLEAMKPYLSDDYGNASSVHWYGQRARNGVETAREQVAALVHARPAEVVFTSGGTEADNLALVGAVEAAPARTPSGAKHVVTTAIEHHAVLNAAQALERRGVSVSYVAPDAEGRISPDDVERALRPETVLVSVMHSNNELGTIQPMEAIARLARERGATFHADAVQSAGKIPLDVERLGADLVSLSAHKLYGPKGVGALYVRQGTRLAPLFYGGHHERDRRPGTENVPGIVGLGKAAEMAAEGPTEESVARLRERLEEGILRGVGIARVNGGRAERLPNTTNLRFEGVDGEALVMALDLAGVACSTGAACSSGSIEPSHVLAAIGLSEQQARSSVRFSLGRWTSEAEVDYALGALQAVVERLRAVACQAAEKPSFGPREGGAFSPAVPTPSK